MTDNPKQTFCDIHELFESIKAGKSKTNINKEFKSGPAGNIYKNYTKGKNIVESYFLACNEQSESIHALFFGDIVATYDKNNNVIIGRKDDLTIILVPTFEPNAEIGEYTFMPNTIVLYTNFSTFVLRHLNVGGNLSDPFVIYSVEQLCGEIAITGSVWNSVYAFYYAIVSRTISYTFLQSINSKLFSFSKTFLTSFKYFSNAADKRAIEENLAFERLKFFNGENTELLSLELFRQKLKDSKKPPKLLQEIISKDFSARRYSPLRADLFDYGKAAEEFYRSDFVTTYNFKEKEFHRDYYVYHKTTKTYDQELNSAAFDVLHMLAIRRNSLFRLGFARRLYNILMPPIILQDQTDPSKGQILFPCVHLFRATGMGAFRRTISMSFILVPASFDLLASNKQIFARSTYIKELYNIKDELLLPIGDPAEEQKMNNYGITDPTAFYKRIQHRSTLPKLIEVISEQVLRNVLHDGSHYPDQISNLIDNMLFAKNREPNMATLLLLTDWKSSGGFKYPWEKWLTKESDQIFQETLFRTLFYRDYISPGVTNSSRNVVPFEHINVGNNLGEDMTGMTLYNHRENMKIILFPIDLESYPNYSLLRWMAWHIYIDSALASLRALIEKFHAILDERNDLDFIIETLNEMVHEFVDLYDLDLTNYFYRKEYEKIRKLLLIDEDYNQLTTQFTSSKEDASLREQRLINKLIFSLTLATVSVTILSTIATNEKWHLNLYLLTSISAPVLIIAFGYVFFDPIRRKFESFFKILKHLKR